VLVSLALVAMIGMVSLVVDLGLLYIAKKSAQAAADAAAMAGVEDGFARMAGSTPVRCNDSTTKCQAETACPESVSAPPADNIMAACLFASRNGFPNKGNYRVTVEANLNAPPTVPGFPAHYWMTVRTRQTVPALFSAILNRTMGAAAARATAALVDQPVEGSIYALNRENDPSAQGTPSSAVGTGMDVQGSSTGGGGGPGERYTVSTDGAIYIASAADGHAPGRGSAGQAGGSAVVEAGGGTFVRGSGEISTQGAAEWEWQNGSPDGDSFRDPMRGKGQPPAPDHTLPEVPVPGGEINGDCSNPTVLHPGMYYSTGPSCKHCTDSVATGEPIRFTGCVTFDAGTSGFGDYVFFGGASFEGTHSVMNFDPGRYIFAGAKEGEYVFSKSNKTLLQDQTPLVGGETAPNTDAGEIFIFTDTNYPGLQVPAAVRQIAGQLGFGEIDIQSGNNLGINLHGLNRDSANLPSDLKDFSPVVFWQDQRNSAVKYTEDGQIDYTSCGPGHTINNPCMNDGAVHPQLHLQAHPEVKLYGVVYQPRGASLTLQGAGTIDAPMVLISGAITTQGSAKIRLRRLSRPLMRTVVALVE